MDSSHPDDAPAWMTVANADEIPSPALLLYRDRIEANLASMVRIAGGPGRLRPHLKTHKLPELVRRQVELGILRAKCATIAEMEIAAANGVTDILLAVQPVGPTVQRLAGLAAAFPKVRFSAVADDLGAAQALSREWRGRPPLGVFLDLDVGQHRTGIRPGPDALILARTLAGLDGLEFRGLHAYDGHLAVTDVAERTSLCDAAFARVRELASALEAAGVPVGSIVAGGSPTFPIHARRPDVELSPGTTVFWDAGYASKLPDLPFIPAVALLTRVISKPAPDLLCLDLGHKAVGSEMPQPRAVFPALPDAVPVSHSEEHLVLRTPRAGNYKLGDISYAIPWHVCPTVALHQEAWVVDGGRADQRWQVTARARRLVW